MSACVHACAGSFNFFILYYTRPGVLAPPRLTSCNFFILHSARPGARTPPRLILLTSVFCTLPAQERLLLLTERGGSESRYGAELAVAAAAARSAGAVVLLGDSVTRCSKRILDAV